MCKFLVKKFCYEDLQATGRVDIRHLPFPRLGFNEPTYSSLPIFNYENPEIEAIALLKDIFFSVRQIRDSHVLEQTN